MNRFYIAIINLIYVEIIEKNKRFSKKQFGYMIAIQNGKIKKCLLKDIAGKKKIIHIGDEILAQAEMLDICLER